MLIGIDGPGSWLLKNTYVGWDTGYRNLDTANR